MEQKNFRNQFNLVYFLDVLEHLDQKNQIRLIKESLASLKKEGLVIFSTPSREFVYGLPTLGWADHKMEYRSREQLLEFLTASETTSLTRNIEVNRLSGRQFARRKRMLILLLFPFLSLAHLLGKCGFKFTFSRRFLESRKPLCSTNKHKTHLDLKYLPRLDNEAKKQTLALIAVLKGN